MRPERVGDLMRPVLFVAPRRHEAEHWAKAWGFDRSAWQHIRDEHDACGLNNVDDGIVFVCGSQPITTHLVGYLQTVGYDTFVDAHDHPTDREPRSALYLLPSVDVQYVCDEPTCGHTEYRARGSHGGWCPTTTACGGIMRPHDPHA